MILHLNSVCDFTQFADTADRRRNAWRRVRLARWRDDDDRMVGDWTRRGMLGNDAICL